MTSHGSFGVKGVVSRCKLLSGGSVRFKGWVKKIECCWGDFNFPKARERYFCMFVCVCVFFIIFSIFSCLDLYSGRFFFI